MLGEVIEPFGLLGRYIEGWCVCLFICQSIHLSIHPSEHLYIHVSILTSVMPLAFIHIVESMSSHHITTVKQSSAWVILGLVPGNTR